jgi:hypothetical protein
VNSVTATIAAGLRRSRCHASAQELRPERFLFGAACGVWSLETSTAKLES